MVTQVEQLISRLLPLDCCCRSRYQIPPPHPHRLPRTDNRSRRFLSAHDSFSFSLSSSSSSFRLSRLSIKYRAAGDTSSVDQKAGIYEGIYGPWTLDSSDVREVVLYRSGLVTAAASFVVSSSTLFLPNDSSLSHFIKPNLDFLYALGAGGLGLSLFLIHIYVTEIKRTLQALWAIGVVGSFATCLSLAHPAGQNLIEYVIDHPNAVWLVGPLFASLTGLVFKEGLCYGKLEAAVLTFIVPSVLLGHLTGWVDNGVKVTLVGLWMAFFVVFAGRKFTQPIKDDIGDKSVFIFNALPEEGKKAIIEKLEQQKYSRNLD